MTEASVAAATEFSRHYRSPDGKWPQVIMEPSPPLPSTGCPVSITVRTTEGEVSRIIYHPYLAFIKFITEYWFDSVMDIGCGDGHEADIFNLFVPDVITINHENTGYPATFQGDYLDFAADYQVQAIWCSHVLEHVRNPGIFLDKIFADLAHGGVLCLTVPYHDFCSPPDVTILGHCNRFNVATLVYHLVMAGFDCRSLRYCVYSGQISILLSKLRNDLPSGAAALGHEVYQFFPPGLSVGSAMQAFAARINWDTPAEPSAAGIW